MTRFSVPPEETSEVQEMPTPVETNQSQSFSRTGSRTPKVTTPTPELVKVNGKEYIVLSVDGSRTEWRASINSNPEDILHFPSNYQPIELVEARYVRPDLNWRNSLDEFCFEFGSGACAVGNMAMQYSAKQGKTTGFVAKLMASKIYFDLDEKYPIALVISLPHPERKLYETYKKEILQEIEKDGGSVGKFNKQKHLLKIDPEMIFFNPEGVNSLVWTDAQRLLNKDKNCPNFKKGGTIVIDMGHEHLSFAYCLNMRFQSVLSVSYVDLSMCNYCNALAERAGISNPESPELIKAILKDKGHRKCNYRGDIYDLDEGVDALFPEYAQNIKDRFKQWIPDAQIDYALVNGGGGKYFFEALSEILIKAEIQPWLTDPYRYANVLGGFYYGKSVLEEMNEFE
jgi:hypothetical protein